MPDESLISPNGGGAQELKPIVVTLTLTPTPAGYALHINHDPTIFPDTVIDACHRAARCYEQITLIQQLRGAAQAVVPYSEAELKRMKGGLLS